MITLASNSKEDIERALFKLKNDLTKAISTNTGGGSSRASVGSSRPGVPLKVDQGPIWAIQPRSVFR